MGGGADASALFTELGDIEWLPAQVPGGVHDSLVTAGALPHPYRDQHEADARWVEDRVWWYRTEFTSPQCAAGERVQLVCHGLDTVVAVVLNGKIVATHANMFRPLIIDVTEHLQPQVNHVALRFTPPLDGLTPSADQLSLLARLAGFSTGETAEGGAADPTAIDKAIETAVAAAVSTDGSPGIRPENLVQPWRRKATFSWGWDFAPHLPSIGIWQPVELVVAADAVLTGYEVRTVDVDPTARTARVHLGVETERLTTVGRLTASVTLTGPDGVTHRADLDLPDGHDRADAQLTVDNAALWWTHDLGAQPLYTVHVALRDPTGRLLDERHDRVGLRTITLDRSPDATGKVFRLRLNGVPVFARGANWVPASNMVGAVPDATTRALVELARDGAMTMLRVWGGGVYESDAFYTACDELGLLVWQDFMFACNTYPSDDDALRADVAAEAAYQVRRLRNHPSLALWAGNNEVHALYFFALGNVDPGNWGWRIFHETLPAAVDTHSPAIPYWPGSPYADSALLNGVEDGDRHAWEVWHGLDIGTGGPTEFASRGHAMHFDRYRHDRGRFISEFGIHASPQLATLQRWTAPGSLALGSAAFAHRNKDSPTNKGDDLMALETGLASDLPQYVDFSMVAQAEGLKFGVEHWRRLAPRSNGALIWQLNDSWPGLSWSVIDYDRVPKAGYYLAARAFAPLLASYAWDPERGLELWLSNSTAQTVTATLRAEVARYSGTSVLDATVTATVDPGSATLAWRADTQEVGAGPDRYAWVSSPDGMIAANRRFFGPVRDQQFGPAPLRATVRRSGPDSATVTVHADSYGYFARVTAPVAGPRFSANYLDVRPGTSTEITVRDLPADLPLADLHVATFGPRPAVVTVAE